MKKGIALLMLGAVMSTSFLKASTIEEDIKGEEVKPSFNALLSVETEGFFCKAGEKIFREILSGSGFDAPEVDLFGALNLESFQKTVEVTNLSKLCVVSNLTRWYFKSADSSYVKARKNYLTAILATCFHLVKVAGKRGELFESGSFTLVDPHHRYLNFLLGYVKLVTGSDNPIELPYLSTVSNFAYRRDPTLGGSSHHKTRSPESQFGIDVRYEPEDCVLMMLPFLKTHILFGKLEMGQGEPLTFLKLEEMGMGSVYAAVLHGVNFTKTRGASAHDSRKEKDIPKDVREAFEQFKTDISLEGDAQTVRDMVLAVAQVGNEVEKEKKALEFLKFLIERYPDHRPDLRVGNEVILNLSEDLYAKQNAKEGEYF